MLLMVTASRVDKMVSLESYFQVSLEKELEKSSKLKVEDIAEIQHWMTTQPNLLVSPGRFTVFTLQYLKLNVVSNRSDSFSVYKFVW